MIIKTVQWNIGGGYIRKKNDEAISSDVYTIYDVSYIVSILKEYTPDIIFLQEAHQNKSNSEKNQIKEIANALGYEYYTMNVISDSHLDVNENLSIGIISHYPLSESQFTFLSKPHAVLQRNNGEIWEMSDKGILSSIVSINENFLELKTLHYFPFRKFGLSFTDELLQKYFTDFDDKLLPINNFPFIISGDFNYTEKTLETILPKTFSLGTKELITDQPTTPRGRYYNRILYNGIHLKKAFVANTALTDHYPIIAEFEI